LTGDGYDFDCTVVDGQQVKRIVPYSLSQLKRLEDQGLFPRRIRLGPNRTGWVLAEIHAWIQERMADRDQVT
jgi:prophage regulatory protein